MEVEDLSLRWLEQGRVFPTRSLELAMARAFSVSSNPSAALIACAALENEPSAAVEHQELIQTLLASRALRKSNHDSTLERQRSAGTTLPFLPSLVEEKSKLLDGHREGYSSHEDYRPAPIEEWSRQVGAGSRRAEDVHVIGPSDYLRLISWSLDLHGTHRRSRFTRSRFGGGFEELLFHKQIDQKSLVKALKKASGSLLPAELATGPHQDLLLLNGPSGLLVRPASFVVEGQLYAEDQSGPDEFLAQSLAFGLHAGLGARDGILELESLLNSTKAVENDFQRLFERYPHLLLGTDYERLVSQPVLVREEEADLVPDFVMVPYSYAAPKIVDLKRPDVSIYRADTNREDFLSPVMQARSQLLEYQSYFSSRAASAQTRERIGADLYLPRIAVVIGRSESFPSTFARRKAESRVPDLEVLTYDDVLDRASRISGLTQ